MALKRWRSESGLAGELCVISTITVCFTGSTQKMVPAVPSFARIVRAAAQPIVGADYVMAARAAGASDLRVLGRHVLPGCASPLVAHATVMLGSAILLASGLSFLGLGVQPPEAEWGSMLSRGRDLLRTAPIGAVAPGVAITATVLSFSLLGDGLRDARGPLRSRVS